MKRPEDVTLSREEGEALIERIERPKDHTGKIKGGSMRKLVISVACVSLLTACGGEKASWDTQESARQQAIDNAELNAKAFRNAYFPDMNIRMRGDSTIDGSCPQGDGWASVDLLSPDGQVGTKVEVKCSTVSAAIGCMSKDDFQKRANYASQEGQCNAALPFPLPKLNK